EQIVLDHAKEIGDILLQNSIIGYSDGSKLDNLDTGAGIYLIDVTQFPEAQSEHPYYLGKQMEVYDAELLAILKTLQLGLKIVEKLDRGIATNIYIFSDSSAAIDRLRKIDDLGPGQNIVRESILVAQKLVKLGAKIFLKWLPSHSGIPVNKNADRIAKTAAQSQNQQPTLKKVSLTNIKRKLNSSILEE